MKINKLITLECIMASSKDGDEGEILNKFNFKQLEWNRKVILRQYDLLKLLKQDKTLIITYHNSICVISDLPEAGRST